MCRNACEWACGRGENFFFCLYSSCVRAGLSQFALVVRRGGYFEVFDIRGGHFGEFDSQRHFPSCFSSFLSVLALGPTVILRVYSCLDLGPEQVDCNMCRFSRLLLFSFFFCKDGSDRLMKRASYSCCNFLCIVLAAAYLKYRRCHLSCLPFVWHLFFHWDTHTHTYPHTHAHTHTRTHAHTRTHEKRKTFLKAQNRSQMSWKLSGKVQARTYGTKSSSRLEALRNPHLQK